MNQKMPSDSTKKKKRPLRSNNFLEALRDLGSGVVDSAVHDVAGGLAGSAFDQISGQKKSGDLRPDQSIELNQAAPQEPRIEKSPRQFQQEYLDIRHQERVVYKQAEQETRLQISAVIEELKKLSLSTKKLAKEVDVASHQVTEPGAYHLNFFERLRQTLIVLRKQIDNSATWLSAFNQRGKKRSYYWGQVQKSGSKFMLSQERYMSTQAG